MSSDRAGVLVVDDSPFMRRLVSDAIAETSDLTVIGEAASGREALERLGALQPAVITLDLEMPELGGLETLGYIMSECPCPVVVLSAHHAREGQDLVMQALALGAVDFVRKPSHGNTIDVETLRRRLIDALRQAVGGRVEAPRIAPPRRWRPASPRPRRDGGSAAPESLVVIAASTGGPKALLELCAELRLPAGAAGIIIQHMPAGFTASLAARLAEQCAHPVCESTSGMALCAGELVVAAGGHNWMVTGSRANPVLQIAEAVRGSVRPEADAVLSSAVDHFGADVTAVILTGMGRDGAEGARIVRQAGGRVLVQDPACAVVGGMPRATLARVSPDLVGSVTTLARAIAQPTSSVPGLSRRA